jgi:neutral ceramidase
VARLSVGAATGDITPAVGCPMGGYGARKGRSKAVAAPLQCRAFVFDDGVAPAVLATCDLLYITYDIAALVRDQLEDALGIAPERVMLTGTHTHSGPSGLTIALDELYTRSVSQKIAGTVAVAYANRRSACLAYAETNVGSISQNRRNPDGPVETTARLLIALAEGEPPSPLATIVNYACHATVLEHDNLELSPDFPGAVASSVEDNVGGVAAYLQGCAGEINPVWARHDHAEARRVGSVLGLAAARAVNEAIPLKSGQWSVNLSMSEDVAKSPPQGFRLVDEAPIGAQQQFLPLALRTRPTVQDAQEELADIEQRLGRTTVSEDRLPLLARRAAVQMEAYFAGHSYSYAEHADGTGGGHSEQIEIQALRLGHSTAVVGVPGEPFFAIGEEIRRRSGFANLLVAGYANEAVGYLPVASEFPLHGYEVGCSRFEPDAAEKIVQAAVSALAGLGDSA